MVYLLEIAGVIFLGAVVFALRRAVRGERAEPGLRIAAGAALFAWIVFALWTLVDLDYVRSNTGPLGQIAVLAGVLIAVVLGYRWALRRIRDRADP